MHILQHYKGERRTNEPEGGPSLCEGELQILKD